MTEGDRQMSALWMIYIQKQLWSVADLTIEISFCYVAPASIGTY